MDKDEIKSALGNTVVVVSGIPRSGTSLMMQMLEAGGITLLIDNKRKPDDNNPKGYYELEAVKKLATDHSCIDEGIGKAVKVISQLLVYLPDTHNYKVIFMQREMDEILRSQQKMLGISSDQDEDLELVVKVFERDLIKAKAWADSKPNVDLEFVNFKDVIETPLDVIQKITSFLQLELNIDKMTEVVDPDLYRNKPELE